MLAMNTKCRKGLIAYHKSNGIMMMNKHFKYDHFALLKMFLEDHVVIEALRSPLDYEPNKKRAIVSPSNIFGFFLLTLSLRNMIWHKWVLWRILCCLWLRACCLRGLLSSFSCKRWYTSCVHELSSHPRKHLLRKFCWIWLRRPWLHMRFFHWLIAYQPLIPLTYGCLIGHVMFLPLLSISSQVTRRQTCDDWIV